MSRERSKISWRQKAIDHFLRSKPTTASQPSTSTERRKRPTPSTATSNATSTTAFSTTEEPCQPSSLPKSFLGVPNVRVPRDRSDFNIVIICALKIEAECVYDALDKTWDDKKYGKARSDDNAYSLGAIGEHNVVIIHMPGMGTDRAAVAAANLRSTFPNIKLALVVGICGGMPTNLNGEEIVLGDIIISEALVRYDFGRQYPEGFKRKSDTHDILGPPSEKILALINKLSTKQHKVVMQDNTVLFLRAIRQKSPETSRPATETDVLFESSYPHRHHSSTHCHTCRKTSHVCQIAVKAECDELRCDPRKRVMRKRLADPSTTQPQIHFGVMGSGNTVMKSGRHRDALAASEGIIAIEMEGAGVWRYGPALVIKGVCDYADSHKRKGWQKYAAATAAACAKAFLFEWAPDGRPSSQESRAPRISNLRERKPFDNSAQYNAESDDTFLDHFQVDQLTDAHISILHRLNDFEPQTQLDLIPERNKSTLSWLNSAPQLTDWIDSSDPYNSILWLCGGVGRGKSVAAKYLVQTVQSYRPHSLVLFAFCDGNDVLRSSGSFIWRSLLYQILYRNHVCAARFFRYFGDKVEQILLASDQYEYTWWLRFILAYALLPPDTEVFIIIDAIDEINVKDRQAILERTVDLQVRRNRQSAIRRHHDIEVSSAADRVKYLITSRPWQMIEDQLARFSVFQMTESNTSSDIRYYIDDEVKRFGRKEKFPETVIDLIVSTIVEKAEAMFVWAHLAWEQFKMIKDDWNQETLDMQIDNLKSLPKGLHSLYKVLVKRLQPSARALQILEWIMYSARPLHLSEFEIAISIKDSSSSEGMLALPFDLRRSVSRLLGPLVRFQETDQSFHLSHLSVKEFFETLLKDTQEPEIEFAQLYNIDASEAHRKIGNICFKYLSFASVPWGPADGLFDALGEKSVSEFATEHKFLEYSALYWDHHLDSADAHVDYAVDSTSVSMERKQHRIQRFWAVEGADINVIHSCGFRPLHFAAMWNWNSILVSLCEDHRTDILAIDDRGFSALFIACWFGFETAATTLIDRGAWQNAFEKTSVEYNVLDLTIKHDLENIACEILKHIDEIVDTSGSYQAAINNFFLNAIALEWRKALDIFMCSSCVRFDHYNDDQQGVLHLCAKHGFVDILSLALTHKLEVDKRDIYGQTPLHTAVAEESSEIVETLLQSGADPNCTDDEGSAALHFAMSIDKVHYVQLLLQYGAKINQADAQGRQAIQLAALWGQSTVFETLLEVPKIKLSATSTNGDSLIHWAAKGRARSVLSKIAQSHRFDRTATDQYGRNVLHIIAPWADPPLINEVLNIPDLDVGSLDSFGQNILHHAIANPDVTVLRMIVDVAGKYGIDVNLRDKYGKTPLHYACRPGKANHIKMLLPLHPKLTIGDDDGKDAGRTARDWGAIDVLELFGWSKVHAIIRCRPDMALEKRWYVVKNREMVPSKAVSQITPSHLQLENTGQESFSWYRLLAVIGLEDTEMFQRWCAGSTELSPVSPCSEMSAASKYALIDATVLTDRPKHHVMAHTLAKHIKAYGDVPRISNAYRNMTGRQVRDYWWEDEPPSIIHEVLRLTGIRLWSHQEFIDSVPQLGESAYRWSRRNRDES